MLTAILIKYIGEKGFATLKAFLTSKLLWITVGLLTISGGSAWYAYSYEHKRWQAQIVEISKQARAQHDVDQAAILLNKQAGEVLASLSNNSKEKLNEQLSKSNNDLSATLRANELLKHPKRPAKSVGVTPPSTTVGDTTYSTAANLYQDDQQLLINFANSTDQVVYKLNSCIERYSLVEESINGQQQTVLPPFGGIK